MSKKNKKSEGFTLVELLVVIAIIGLLSTLSIIALNNARMKARDAVRVAAIKQIQTALELYYNDSGAYPQTTSGTPGNVIRYKGATYMGIIPSNPAPTTDGPCIAVAGTDAPFTYASVSPFKTYTLAYCLGGTSGGVAPGLHTATPVSLTNP
jgi:prepilin-type N-terminal cleavage/methylation domain-containing protein